MKKIELIVLTLVLLMLSAVTASAADGSCQISIEHIFNGSNGGYSNMTVNWGEQADLSLSVKSRSGYAVDRFEPAQTFIVREENRINAKIYYRTAVSGNTRSSNDNDCSHDAYKQNAGNEDLAPAGGSPGSPPADNGAPLKEVIIHYQGTNGGDIHACTYIKAPIGGEINLSDYVIGISDFRHVGYRPANGKVRVVSLVGPTDNSGAVIYEKWSAEPETPKTPDATSKPVNDPNAPAEANQLPDKHEPVVTETPYPTIEIPRAAHPETRLNHSDRQTLKFIQGYPDNTMRPLNPITREEVATIFYQVIDPSLKEVLHPETAMLRDISASDWSYQAVGSLVASGIMLPRNGYNFEPKALATRAEVAQVLSAFLPLDAPPAASNFFNDINGIPEREAILKVANTGWVSGYEDGSFRPYNNITRAELITVINNLLYRTIKAPVQDLTFKDVHPYQWFYNSIATAMFGNI